MTLIKNISGFRGTIGGENNKNLTPIDVVNSIAGFSIFLKKKYPNKTSLKVMTGRDGRKSGQAIHQIVNSVFSSMGINVIDCGISTTPTLCWGVLNNESIAGLMITASHNPEEYNGLKFFNSDGEFLAREDVFEVIKNSEKETFEFSPNDKLGTIDPYHNLIEDHTNAIVNLEILPINDIKKLNINITADAINSGGAISIPKLLDKLNISYQIINSEIEGKFSHTPEPLKENLEELSKEIVNNKSDFGIAVDPDVDRLVFFDENGNILSEENTQVLCSDFVLSQQKGSTVSTLSSSNSLKDITQKYGCDYYFTPVGEMNVVELGNLAALTTLDLGNNELSGVLPAELGNLAALTTLDLGNNELSGALPNTLANLTNLLNLKLENNAFTGLSDLTALTQLIVFSVQNNQLDFGDLQPNIAVLTVYSPQKPVREGENYTLPNGSNLMLSVDVDGTGNIYQWFYNSNPIANASNSSLDLMDLQAEESGLYYCEISNPNVPSLILASSADTLTVVPNADPTGIALSNNSIEENLAIGTLIGLFSTTDANPTDKHTYTISDNTNFQISADSLYANISFDYETIESYDLTVTSTDLGGLTYSDDLIISIIDGDYGGLVTGIEDVFTQTETVLYPNPSTNFLHIRGLKKIGVVELLFYNLQGQIVKEYSEIQDVYDVSDLPKGFYIALIKTLNFEKTINFIIN